MLTCDSVQGHNIGGRTTEEEKGHCARAGRLRRRILSAIGP